MTSPALGCLLRIDPLTGAVLWSTDTVSFSDLYRPAGGNSGVFVLLKSLNQSEKMRKASSIPLDVRISVLRDTDGTEVSAADSIPLTLPVSVQRTATDGSIRITAAGGGVLIKPEPPTQ
jgi:hypothetical protein